MGNHHETVRICIEEQMASFAGDVRTKLAPHFPSVQEVLEAREIFLQFSDNQRSYPSYDEIDVFLLGHGFVVVDIDDKPIVAWAVTGLHKQIENTYLTPDGQFIGIDGSGEGNYWPVKLSLGTIVDCLERVSIDNDQDINGILQGWNEEREALKQYKSKNS